MALRVGYEKLQRETGWEPKISWEEGVLPHDPLVCRAARPLDRARRLADARARNNPLSRVLVTGGSGFLGSHLVERLEAQGHEVFVAAPGRVRPDALGGHQAPVRRREAGARVPPGRRGRRHRREPREPRPLLVREPDDGRACPRARPAQRDAEARDARDDLRVPEVHPGAVPRERPLERLPGRDERAVRHREEVGAGRRPVVPRRSTARTRSTCCP